MKMKPRSNGHDLRPALPLSAQKDEAHQSKGDQRESTLLVSTTTTISHPSCRPWQQPSRAFNPHPQQLPTRHSSNKHDARQQLARRPRIFRRGMRTRWMSRASWRLMMSS